MKGITKIALILLSIFFLVGCEDKVETINNAKNMLKKSCERASNSLNYKENGDVTTASLKNALKILKDDIRDVDKLINGYEYLTGGPNNDNKMNASYNDYVEKVIKEYGQFHGLSISNDVFTITSMRTHYPETLGSKPAFTCTLNKMNLFYRIKDEMSKKEKDFIYMKEYPKEGNKTSLMKAADDCNIEAVKYMLSSKQGGDINATNGLNDALRYSMSYSYHNKEKCNNVSRTLIDEGANIERKKTGESLLQIAIKKHDLAMVEYLIQKGFKLEIGDLHYATYKGTPEIVKVLLNQNMDTSVSLPKKYNSLEKLYEKPILNANSIETMKLLIKYGANINERDTSSRSLLHVLSLDVYEDRFIDFPSKLAIYALKNNAIITEDSQGDFFQKQAMINLLNATIYEKKIATEFIAELMSYKPTLFSKFKFVDDNMELFKIDSMETQWITEVKKSENIKSLTQFIEEQQNLKKKFVLVIGTGYDYNLSHHHVASRFTAETDGGDTIMKIQEKVDLPFLIIDNELQKDMLEYLTHKYNIKIRSTPYAIFYKNGNVIDSFVMLNNGSSVDKLVKLSQ
ncbi:MAG: ankyrin repeat domain-containing protein [Candidatus Marinarcus sp.]|uniref:ankyrin repeat domain-containing protein n=1 Tax=Candidatus Marinarcus sp. TaxID=3100987 RepID=UPI003B00C588